MTEYEFLDRQCRQVRGELRTRLWRAEARIESSPALRDNAERHPWLTTAAAAAAGLLVGRLVTHRHRRPKGSAESPGKDQSNGKFPIWLPVLLGGPLGDLLQRWITTLAVALVESRHTQPDGGNGHAATPVGESV